MQENLFDFVDSGLSFPCTYDDISRLWEEHLREEDTDEDAFTSKDTSFGQTYFFYAEKAFEFKPGASGKSRLKLPTELMRIVFPDRTGMKENAYYTVALLDHAQMSKLAAALRQRKADRFRALGRDQFGCCNDFVACSDAKACIHQDDRDCNGCMYRRNLEQGRIFYGKNRNTWYES